MKISTTCFNRNLVIRFFSFAYFYGLFYIVFFDGERYRTNYGHALNLVPVQKIFLFFAQNQTYQWSISYKFYLDFIGNFLLFIPFALAVQALMNRWYSARCLFMQVFLISFSIELTQYCLGIGVADSDDVLLNVLGGVLGVLLSRFP